MLVAIPLVGVVLACAVPRIGVAVLNPATVGGVARALVLPVVVHAAPVLVHLHALLLPVAVGVVAIADVELLVVGALTSPVVLSAYSLPCAVCVVGMVVKVIVEAVNVA